MANLSGLSELDGGKLFLLLESPGEGSKSRDDTGKLDVGELRGRVNFFALIFSLVGLTTLQVTQDGSDADVTNTLSDCDNVGADEANAKDKLF